jgi:hypothetical protein
MAGLSRSWTGAAVSVFFGEHWGAPILEYAQLAPTLVGVGCYLCDRPIHRGNQGFIRPVLTRRGSEFQPGNADARRGDLVGRPTDLRTDPSSSMSIPSLSRSCSAWVATPRAEF